MNTLKVFTTTPCYRRQYRDPGCMIKHGFGESGECLPTLLQNCIAVEQFGWSTLFHSSYPFRAHMFEELRTAVTSPSAGLNEAEAAYQYSDLQQHVDDILHFKPRPFKNEDRVPETLADPERTLLNPWHSCLFANMVVPLLLLIKGVSALIECGILLHDGTYDALHLWSEWQLSRDDDGVVESVEVQDPYISFDVTEFIDFDTYKALHDPTDAQGLAPHPNGIFAPAHKTTATLRRYGRCFTWWLH